QLRDCIFSDLNWRDIFGGCLAMTSLDEERMLPTRLVCKRYSVTDRTIDRWLASERKSADNTLWQPHSSAYTPQRGRHLNRYVYSHPNWELNWSCIAPLPLVHRLSGRLRPWGCLMLAAGSSGLSRVSLGAENSVSGNCWTTLSLS